MKPRMPQLIALVSIFLLVSIWTKAIAEDKAQTQTDNQAELSMGNIGDVAQEFSEPDLQERTIILKAYRGKVVILNFWATWCPPCKMEIPLLEELETTHRGQLEVIGASVFCSYSDTQNFCKDYGINYPVIFGSYDLMFKYGKVRAIPTTFLISKKGIISFKVVGYRTKEQYEDMLKPLLAE
jgi:cytochrome c biogenesis protein CcmG, thiol:disulfide interchange protein DsbE